MKKIKLIPDVNIPEAGKLDVDKGEREGLPFSMIKFLNICLNGHEKFGKGLDGVSQGLKIKNTYENPKNKGFFQLEEPEYAELKKAVEGAALTPILAMGCKIYYEAINDAVDVEVTQTVESGKGKKK